MYHRILVPTEKDHVISLPPELYGKQVEIISFDVVSEPQTTTRKKNFLDDIEPIPDFPSIDKMRNDGWPEKW